MTELKEMPADKIDLAKIREKLDHLKGQLETIQREKIDSALSSEQLQSLIYEVKAYAFYCTRLYVYSEATKLRLAHALLDPYQAVTKVKSPHLPNFKSAILKDYSERSNSPQRTPEQVAANDTFEKGIKSIREQTLVHWLKMPISNERLVDAYERMSPEDQKQHKNNVEGLKLRDRLMRYIKQNEGKSYLFNSGILLNFSRYYQAREGKDQKALLKALTLEGNDLIFIISSIVDILTASDDRATNETLDMQFAVKGLYRFSKLKDTPDILPENGREFLLILLSNNMGELKKGFTDLRARMMRERDELMDK